MPSTYTLTADGASAIRSDDGAVVPWDRAADRPVEDGAYAWRIWQDDGAPRSLPAPPAPSPDAPEVISDRQCFQQLAVMNKITQDEALAAVTVGALPKAVTDGIAGLPAAQQFPAKMLLCGATEFHRSHPMVLVFLSFFGLGESDRDPLWTAAAAL